MEVIIIILTTYYASFFLSLSCRVMEQPQAIGKALGFGGRLYLNAATLGGLDSNYDRLKNIESLTVLGCGSSFNAANYGARLLKHMNTFTQVSAADADAGKQYRVRPIIALYFGNHALTPLIPSYYFAYSRGE